MRILNCILSALPIGFVIGFLLPLFFGSLNTREGVLLIIISLSGALTVILIFAHLLLRVGIE